MQEFFNDLCMSCTHPCKQPTFTIVIECTKYTYNGGKLPKQPRALLKQRELTYTEKSEIRKLIITICANYDNHYKQCLLLDTQCPMLLKHDHNGKLCKYFMDAVLPLNRELEHSLSTVNSANKKCGFCRCDFYTETHKKYCSTDCTYQAKKNADKLRAKKYRKSKR